MEGNMIRVQESYDYINMDPSDIEPLNGITDQIKYESLVQSFKRDGYNGVPVLVGNECIGIYEAITGSHRIYAAREAGIDIPCVIIDDDEIFLRISDGTDDTMREGIAKEMYDLGELEETIYTILKLEDK
jgi:hypothetical protein